MTVKTDIAALAPTASALATFQAHGVNFNMLMGQLKQQAIELQTTVKTMISFHPLDSVLTAVVNAGGSGGTNGAVTITGTTGTGTRFTARGNISGGALSGALTIINAGSYSVDPTTPPAEPVSGGGLSGATISLTLSGDNAVLASLNSILSELL